VIFGVLWQFDSVVVEVPWEEEAFGLQGQAVWGLLLPRHVEGIRAKALLGRITCDERTRTFDRRSV
jgi:hypothetical protein